MMKKLSFLLFAVLMSFSSFSQAKFQHAPGQSDGDTPIPPQLVTFEQQNVVSDIMSLWALPSNGATSANSRAPSTGWKYQRTEYLITPTEMATSGLTSGNILTNIAWNIVTAGTGTLNGTLNIYLMNTANTTYSLGTSWTIAGFTQVCANSSYTVPTTLGVFDVPFTTPFTYTGQGLYVAWEFSSPLGTVGTAPVHDCNTSLTNGLYGQRSTTALPTTLAASNWRPATRLTTSSYDDYIGITNIYATEKLPLPYGLPTTIGVRYTNNTTSSVTFDLTLTIRDQSTSTLRYTSTQTGLTIAAGASATVSYNDWAPTIQENLTITATTSVIAGETWTINNTRSISANVNGNLFGYNYTLTPSTGYGFTYNVGGIFANKYMMNGQGSVPAANLFIYNYAANTGRTIYAVVLNSAGAIVAQSADLIIAAGDLGTNKTFTFPTPPVFDNEIFYVGLAQSTLGATVAWFPMGSVSESPQRGSTFYTFGLTGGTPSESTNPYKYMIEAQVAAYSIAHDVGTLSIDDVPTNITIPASIIPKATVKNFGSNTETFDVTMTTTGYTSTQTVTALAPGTTTQVTFDAWNPSIGQYSIQICTGLTGDLEPVNDCKTKTSGVYSTSWAAGSAYPATTYLGTGVGYTDNSVSPPVGYLYSFGGNTTSTLGTESYKYNTNTDTWTPIASLPTKRVVSCSAISGNNIYIIGGSDGTIYTTVVYKYDIAGDVYSTVAPLPIGTAWCKAVAYGTNYIYLAGGNDGTNTLSTVYVYDIALDTWTAATAMPGAKFGGAFSVSGNTLVYVGGSNGSTITNSVYVGTISESDPTSITWAIKTSYPGSLGTKSGDEIMNSSSISTTVSEPGATKVSYPGGTMYRFDAAPWGTKGIIFAAGSPTSAWTPADPNPCYVYKPSTDTWTKYPDLTIPVLGPSLGSVDLNNGGNHTWKIVVASGLSLTAASTATQILSETMLNDVTFQVNMSQQTVSPNGVHIAGNFQGWNPGSTALTEIGGGIYSITIPLAAGSYEYKFINGNAWGSDESIPGACNVNGNRGVTVTGDMVLDPVCFAQCGPCQTTVSLTFQVDMSQQTVSPNGVHVTGAFNGWSTVNTPMTDIGGNIYSATVLVNENSTTQYKFINGNSWGSDEGVPAACGVDNGFGGYNREVSVTTSNVTLPLVCYAECAACAPATKTLNLTVLLEGLYAPGGTMNQAFDDIGAHFVAPVADQITLELHDATTYATVDYSTGLIDLNQDGTATALIPATYSGSYYLTVKHRNSLETTTAAVVDFSGSTIAYDFTTAPSQAFGDNLKDMGEGKFVIFGGDANADGSVDALDLIAVDNDATAFTSGYLPTDSNGDGAVDALDLILTDNNSTLFIAAILP